MQKIPIGIPFFQRNGDTERLSNLPQIKENIAKSKSYRQLQCRVGGWYWYLTWYKIIYRMDGLCAGHQYIQQVFWIAIGNEQLDVKGRGLYVGGSGTKGMSRVARTYFEELLSHREEYSSEAHVFNSYCMPAPQFSLGK